MLFTTILLLLAAHYVADYAMQNQYVATAKGEIKRPDWIHALTAHAVHHALLSGIALFVLSLPWLLGASIIGISHWLIDFGKSALHWYGIHVDQILHIIVIVVTSIYLVNGGL